MKLIPSWAEGMFLELMDKTDLCGHFYGYRLITIYTHGAFLYAPNEHKVQIFLVCVWACSFQHAEKGFNCTSKGYVSYVHRQG